MDPGFCNPNPLSLPYQPSLRPQNPQLCPPPSLRGPPSPLQMNPILSYAVSAPTVCNGPMGGPRMPPCSIKTAGDGMKARIGSDGMITRMGGPGRQCAPFHPRRPPLPLCPPMPPRPPNFPCPPLSQQRSPGRPLQPNPPVPVYRHQPPPSPVNPRPMAVPPSLLPPPRPPPPLPVSPYPSCQPPGLPSSPRLLSPGCLPPPPPRQVPERSGRNPRRPGSPETMGTRAGMAALPSIPPVRSHSRACSGMKTAPTRSSASLPRDMSCQGNAPPGSTEENCSCDKSRSCRCSGSCGPRPIVTFPHIQCGPSHACVPHMQCSPHSSNGFHHRSCSPCSPHVQHVHHTFVKPAHSPEVLSDQTEFRRTVTKESRSESSAKRSSSRQPRKKTKKKKKNNKKKKGGRCCQCCCMCGMMPKHPCCFQNCAPCGSRTNRNKNRKPRSPCMCWSCCGVERCSTPRRKPRNRSQNRSPPRHRESVSRSASRSPGQRRSRSFHRTRSPSSDRARRVNSSMSTEPLRIHLCNCTSSEASSDEEHWVLPPCPGYCQDDRCRGSFRGRPRKLLATPRRYPSNPGRGYTSTLEWQTPYNNDYGRCSSGVRGSGYRTRPPPPPPSPYFRYSGPCELPKLPPRGRRCKSVSDEDADFLRTGRKSSPMRRHGSRNRYRSRPMVGNRGAFSGCSDSSYNSPHVCRKSPHRSRRETRRKVDLEDSRPKRHKCRCKPPRIELSRY